MTRTSLDLLESLSLSADTRSTTHSAPTHLAHYSSPPTDAPGVMGESLNLPADLPPTPVIDHAGLPHVFDAILSHAPLSFFRALRATSRDMHARANAVLYEHVCLSVARGKDAEGNEFPVLSFREPYSRARIPGLRWEDRETTLQLLKKYTRILDDRGSVSNLWWNSAAGRQMFDELDGLALADALSPDIVREPGLTSDGFPYVGWGTAVKRSMHRARVRIHEDYDGNNNSRFDVDLDESNLLHQRIAASRHLRGQLPVGVAQADVRPLLPATTRITFMPLEADGDPHVPTHGFAPSTTRLISNVAFADTVRGYGTLPRGYGIRSWLPAHVSDIIVIFAKPPTDDSWTWAEGDLGVLQNVLCTASCLTGRARTITLVGLEHMDPVYYRRKGSLSTPWEERKGDLAAALRAAAGVAFDIPPPTPPTVVAVAAPMPGWGPGPPIPVPPPFPLQDSSETWRPPTWRLLTFAEWRAEVGDELYSLATVAPWDPWPEHLPMTRASMGR